MRLLVYRLSLEIIFMRAGTLSTLFTAVPFACQVEGPKYTYKMNEWMNEWMNKPSKLWATGTYSVLCCYWRCVNSRHTWQWTLHATELQLASTGGCMPVRLSLELAWLRADCPSPLGSDSAGRGQGSAFVFGREIWQGHGGALEAFPTWFPYRGVELCKCQ